MEIGGEAYRINTDFRAGIAYAMAIMAQTPIRAGELLGIYFPDGIPKDRETALHAINDFFAGGEAEPSGDDERADPPILSYTADADALLAEFERVYHIDLTTAKLHWWHFTALLRGLITHSFSERVKYRTSNPNDIKDKNTRAQWQRLKEAYRLDAHGERPYEPQTVEELNEWLLRQARGEERR